jgi:hypothetical protein
MHEQGQKEVKHRCNLGGVGGGGQMHLQYFFYWRVAILTTKWRESNKNDYLGGVKTERTEKPAFYRMQNRGMVDFAPIMLSAKLCLWE